MTRKSSLSLSEMLTAFPIGYEKQGGRSDEWNARRLRLQRSAERAKQERQNKKGAKKDNAK